MMKKVLSLLLCMLLFTPALQAFAIPISAIDSINRTLATSAIYIPAEHKIVLDVEQIYDNYSGMPVENIDLAGIYLESLSSEEVDKIIIENNFALNEVKLDTRLAFANFNPKKYIKVFVKSIANGAYKIANFLFIDDIRTLFHPDSSLKDRLLAGAGFIPHAKILKAGKILIRFRNSKGAIVTREVPDNSNNRKIIDDAIKKAKQCPCHLKMTQLGSKLGDGGNKLVYAYGENQAVGVLKPQISSKAIDTEIAILKSIERYKLPTVNAQKILVDGKPAILMDRFAKGSKDIVKTVEGVVQIVGHSKLLNQQSINDLVKIKQIMIKSNVRIHDLQFLIAKNGRVVIADPLKLITNMKPSETNIKTIDLLIKVAKTNVNGG